MHGLRPAPLALSALFQFGLVMGQEATRYGLPERNVLDGMAGMGGGAQMTPDGRLVLTGWSFNGTWTQTSQNGWPRNTWNGGTPPIQPGWTVQVVRPEAVTRSANYQPVFTPAVFSARYLVEPGADHGDNQQNGVTPYMEHANATYGNAFIQSSASAPYTLPATRTTAPPAPIAGTFPGAVASGISNKEHTTWYPDPILDTSPLGETPATNPYACDVDGVPLNGIPAPESAQYVAYEMIAIVFSEYVSRQQSGGNWYWSHNSLDNRAKQAPIKVVVANPYTTSAYVYKAWVTGYAQNLTYSGAPGGLVRFAEVSITQDGHFLVGHGRVPNYDPATGDNRYNSGTFAFDHVIWATWRTDPTNPAGWREPVLLSDIHRKNTETVKVVGGVNIPLRDVIRLSRQPMRYQNGDTVGHQLVGPGGWLTARDGSMGAYPWVHWDGDGILHPIGGARGTIAYCGIQTNFTYTTLDAANISHLFEISGEEHNTWPNPQNPDEHVEAGLMAMTGPWDVYRRTSRAAGRAILDAEPVHPREPVIAFIHGAKLPKMTLTNISFEDWNDGEYLAFLHMTPVIERVDRISYPPGLGNVWTRHKLDQAADTSGKYQEAKLLPFANPLYADVPTRQAAFTVGTSTARPFNTSQSMPWRRPIFDTGGATLGYVNGRIGEGVRLGREGYVQLTIGPHTPDIDQPWILPAVTAEAFVKVTPEYLALSRTQPTQLFLMSSVLSAGITPTGALTATATDQVGKLVTATTPTTPFAQSYWRHVAVTYANGLLTIYVDGIAVASTFSTDGEIPLLEKDYSSFEIGPHSTVSGSDAVLMFVDEFRLSRIARSAEEIARHAYVETDRVWETNTANLPPLSGTPVRVEDCRVEIGRPWTAAKSAFGSHVFSDVALSLNKNYSCASCHIPSAGFSDQRALAKGHAGGILPFSSPTLANAVTGVEMFWDMRAPSLAAQVTQPIMTPIELGFTNLTTALARLNGDGTTVALHQTAFGTSTITASTLEQGLTAYVQSLIVPDTPVEDYENGNATALTLQEKRGRALFHGKARCVACHEGPSLTNGLAMSTGASTTGQVGVSAYTGRARDMGAFKVPTLRRASDASSQSTAPYFHDGFASNLTDVVNFYNAGGGPLGTQAVSTSRISIGLPHIDLMPLSLSAAEKTDLIAFLRRLGQ